MKETLALAVQSRSAGVRRYTVKEAVRQKAGAGERNMAEFDRDWAALLVSVAKIEESAKSQVAALEEIRRTQQERAQRQEELDKRLTALEDAAWTGRKFRDSLPKVAAVGTITGLIAGLVIWIIKHFHV